MLFRAVFFDLDDTLVDALECHRRASREAFTKFGLDYEKAEELTKDIAVLGRRVVDILKMCKEALGCKETDLPLLKLVNKREKIFFRLLRKNARVYPGAEAALKQAKEKCEVAAVVSSGTRKYIRIALKRFRLEKYVDYIVGAEDVKRGKPEQDCYLKAFSLLPQNLGIKKKECLVVEDSLNGVQAGKAAGFRVLWVPSKYGKGKIEADWEVGSLEEFDLNKLV